jgi:uncharacterized lipoprotein
MIKLLIPVFLSTVLWGLVACSSEPTCEYSKERYMGAQSVAPLRAPDGLSTPDRTAALVIPPVPADAKPIPSGKTACLDRPPSYFSTKAATTQPEAQPAAAAVPVEPK